MARKPGDRNRDYAQTRQDILIRLHADLVPPRGTPPSLRELAKAAGVSLPTLRHYFGGREAVITAVLEFQGQMGEPYLKHLGWSDREFEVSIREAVFFLAEGLFEAQVSDIHAFGLAEGTQSSVLGRTYRERLLEPTLQALESRLACHVRRQEMKPVDLRMAALQLAAPLILASLHQGVLGGAESRPLDREALCEAVIGSFVQSFRA
jgi:AcrR family transcriptional regulator